MWVACATVAYPLASEDGGRSAAAAAGGAEPIAKIVERLASTDAIVSVLRDMVYPFREPDDRRRDRELAPKAVLCQCVGDRTYHDSPIGVRFHRCWPHRSGVVIRSAACG
jgi:hypothetical protein